ncbi:MAG: bifunctional pyr operon transcriptional regulator/uracil phosphoribosyltransferase PyrR [Bacteroidota bacterium]|jgi:pyrimidine operon attenuation protein/uracil phosphoribosyltransferase|nr:bifunctional pyr operon transcriptional regulator/uracil phosphoribosyltransferase PyrR [Bacteroidota bacterium]|tara:strand:+ start:475 stop:1020 length:546 start_codon:yes stop_codon:yes gene_type:complete
MNSTEILNSLQLSLTIRRLCFQLIENHHDFSNTVLVGLQPNGVFLVNRLKKELEKIINKVVKTGALDITFFRDDFRRKEKPLIPSVTNIDFSLENKIVVLVDDVFFTGRTVRSGLDAIMTFGRPKSVEFLTLIERRFTQHLPIKADYIGQSIDTINEEKVSVRWKEEHGKDQILLYSPNET